MLVKNKRIIINENTLELEINNFEKILRNFFETDSRFSKYDIGVFVEFDDECWNDDTRSLWNELNIRIINYDKLTESGEKLKGQQRFATALITYTTENHEPQLVMNNGKPEFYYVFRWSCSTLTNSLTWENNRDNITVENIVTQLLEKFELN